MTLLKAAIKSFVRGIFNRIQEPIEKIPRKNQAGFWKDKSTRDQIFVIRKIIEEAQEW